MKPAVRQTRPTQHHSCPRRRPTGDLLPWSVTQESHQNASFPPHLTSTVGFFYFDVFIFFHHNKNDLPSFIWLYFFFVFVHILFHVVSLCYFKF